MLLEQVAEIHDGGAIRRALSRDNRANRHGGDFVQGIFHGTVAQVVPMLHAVNTQHGLQRIGPSAIARLGIKRLDDSGHILPWQNLLHAGEENLFSGLTALSAEFTIGEGELMTHDEPLGWLRMTYMISYQGLVRTFLIMATCYSNRRNDITFFYYMPRFLNATGLDDIDQFDCETFFKAYHQGDLIPEDNIGQRAK
jgi:hypothetical protein